MSSLYSRAAGAALLGLCVFTAGADVPRFDTAREPAVDLSSWKPYDPQRLGGPPQADFVPQPFDPVTAVESEPNGTSATATPIALTGGAGRITGYAILTTDEDWYVITAQAGDRLYAATQTQASVTGTGDTTLDVFASDGTTILETDTDDGTLGGTGSVIAGTVLPDAGTYYLRVRANGATQEVRPYVLYAQLRSGAPTPETEPNNNPTPQPMGASRWFAGDITSTTTDNDTYSLELAAGDTVYVSTDGDPTRNGTDANLRIGLGLFNANFLVVNDAGVSAPDGEAFFMTVQNAGTYTVYVDAPATPIGDYHLSVTVFPAPVRAGACTTYTSPAGGVIADAGITTFPISVPDDVQIEDVDVSIDLTHANPPDLDMTLQSPAGNELPLFTDIGVNTQPVMVFGLDDEAAIATSSFNVYNGEVFRPEIQGRLEFVDGESSAGIWTLVVRDDATTNTGTLNGWSLRICAKPPAPVVCPAGTALATAYTSDFESDDGGFTHSGTLDEWERGAPSFAPITTCNSGANCWKTDLDGQYENGSVQNLLSPQIDLSGFVAPIEARWSQRYSMESASFDHYRINAQSASLATSVPLFNWTGATMNQTIGTPATAVQFSAGWAPNAVSISALAGAPDAQLVFHLDSDSSVQLTGAAIDDVSVVGCRAISADAAVTITDGVTSVTAGDPVVYTIVASSPADATGTIAASLTATFDAQLIGCTWTCIASPGATCSSGGAGNIDADVTLPPGGDTTFTATCTLPGSATGTLTSSADLVLDAGNDPSLVNNVASDTDTITPATDALFANGFE